MRRVISLYLPSLATDRLRGERGEAAAPPDAPLVTVGRQGQKRVILALDQAARSLGLQSGMTLAHARAMIPGLAFEEAAPAEDADALYRLAVLALRRFSPLVALDPPDGLWIDAAGCAHLFGGEARMLEAVAGAMEGEGFAARAAMAGTAGAAHALARFGAASLMPPVGAGREAAALESLPVLALRLAEETVDELRRLGIDRIGDLLDMPRGPLARRFGAELVRRLDQALGFAAEPFALVTSPSLIRAVKRFVEPIGTAEQLARAIAGLAAMLCGSLTGKGLGARRLDLAFHRVDARIEAVRIGTAAPSRDPAHLTRLLADRLDRVDPGFGVETMTLAASIAEPLDARQLASGLAGTRREVDLSGLVDTLINRLGPDRLYRLAPVESDVPERSLRSVPALAPPLGMSWPEHVPRPARLLAPPEPIEAIALLPDYPPAQFTWRGRRHRVGRADGPERIFGEWWRRDAEMSAVRDYFQLEDEAGSRFWVYRAGDGVDPATGSQRWFLHGLFG
jgi:protein ImuB